MLIAALLVRAKNGNKYPSTDGWRDKTWHIYKVDIQQSEGMKYYVPQYG